MLDPLHPIATNSDSFQTAHALIAFVAAAWGGITGYLWQVKNGLKFSIFSLVVHMSMSGFAGFMCWLGCQHLGFSSGLTGFCCGLAGHMGAQFIALIESRFGSVLSFGKVKGLPDANLPDVESK